MRREACLINLKTAFLIVIPNGVALRAIWVAPIHTLTVGLNIIEKAVIFTIHFPASVGQPSETKE
jgi:hypothetical protein